MLCGLKPGVCPNNFSGLFSYHCHRKFRHTAERLMERQDEMFAANQKDIDAAAKAGTVLVRPWILPSALDSAILMRPRKLARCSSVDSSISPRLCHIDTSVKAGTALGVRYNNNFACYCYCYCYWIPCLLAAMIFLSAIHCPFKIHIFYGVATLKAL
jgi:hypothetical protein